MAAARCPTGIVAAAFVGISMDSSQGNDHTLLARVDENTKNILLRMNSICETIEQHDVRLRKLEVAQAEINIKIGIGATLSGLAAAIVGVFVKP